MQGGLGHGIDSPCITVHPARAGQRLDVFVSQALGMSRRDASELIQSAAVQLLREGREPHTLTQKSFTVQTGMAFRVAVEKLTRALPDSSIPLDVLLETPEVVVVNKPAGLPSAAERNSSLASAASAALARFRELEGIGGNRYEPGLLHRLDTQTSGALLFARTCLAFEQIRKVWASDVQKRYLALSKILDPDLELAPGTEILVESDLTPHKTSPKRVSLAPGKRFKTRAKLVARSADRALFDVEVHAAYRHQIRIHLASRSLPLVGDAIYGPRDEHSPRHALHAYCVACCTREPTFWAVAPLPGDFIALLGPAFSGEAAKIVAEMRSKSKST
jgi:23S rRNA pseudouridine1911/1915/1917 synthase